MDTIRVFVFLALSSVLVTNAIADWPLLDTIFFRHFCRNCANTDINIQNATDLVPLLDTTQKTMFYMHGYIENLESESARTVTEAGLSYISENIIGIDYRQIALMLYPTVVEYAPHVGAAIAKALDEMVQAGLDPVKIHLVGHSMGAQVSGYIGRNSSFDITQITGLDPAGPLFDVEYLSKTDALFVSIIHTDAGYYGNAHISGTVDFMPNFGRRFQPGCLTNISNSLNEGDFCSHHRSWRFYAESMKNLNAFSSIKCNNDSEFMTGACNNDDTTLMGYGTPNTASGLYYCQTNSQSPYGLETQGLQYNPLIV